MKRDYLVSSLYCQLCPFVTVPEINSYCTTKITSENHCDNVHKFLPPANSRSASERTDVSKNKATFKAEKNMIFSFFLNFGIFFILREIEWVDAWRDLHNLTKKSEIICVGYNLHPSMNEVAKCNSAKVIGWAGSPSTSKGNGRGQQNWNCSVVPGTNN